MLMNLPEKVKRDLYINLIYKEYLKKFKRFFYVRRDDYLVNYLKSQFDKKKQQQINIK